MNGPPESLAALSRWIESEEGADLRERAPAPLDESSWVLEHDRRGRAVARVRTRDQTIAVLAPRAGRWAWLPPHDDEDLPLGRWIAEPGQAERALGDQLDEIEGLFCVAHRPGRRMVLRVRGKKGGRLSELYVKGHRRSAFRRARGLHRRLLDSDLADLLSLPSLFLEPERALVFPATEGATLHELGRRGLSIDDGAVSRALHRFWNADGAWCRGLRERGLEDERASAITMLRRASGMNPELETLAERIAAFALPAPEGPRGIVHGDLHDRQILVGPSGAQLIDLDTIAAGPLWIDVVNLREHAALRVQQGVWSARRAHSLERSIASALPGATEPLESEVLRYLVRARLLAVYTLRPARKGVVQWLVQRLNECTSLSR